MNAHIITDLGYGDSGKGSTVDYIIRAGLPTARFLVIRLQGGHQVGHTVKFEEPGKTPILHEFRNFGSGVFQDVPTWYGPETTMFPLGLETEYEQLSLRNFEPVNYYHPDVMVTTSYDIAFNRWCEDSKGVNRHGSVGMGFNATIERNKKCQFTVGMMVNSNPYILKLKLQSIKDYYRDWGVPSSVLDIIDLDIEIRAYLDVTKIVKILELPDHELYSDIIFEPNQGILLDQKYGIFPHVTRSTTTSAPAYDYVNKHLTAYKRMCIYRYAVSRCYHTRHGAGPFEQFPIKLRNTEMEVNKFNLYQHDFKVSKLDLQLLEYALRVNFLEHDLTKYTYTTDHIIFTCYDQLMTKNIECISREDGVVHELGLTPTQFKEYLIKQLNVPEIKKAAFWVSDNPKMNLTDI